MTNHDNGLPLAGIRVVEFTHMVMGPAVGAVLVELGAEVVRVEPVGGDSTRELRGSGAGYFPMYNRNKKSICLDLKNPHAAEEESHDPDVLIAQYHDLVRQVEAAQNRLRDELAAALAGGGRTK